ncbi:MAG: winged helix-turn-helix transcriptional regulator [Caulobacter sp.]|nr:winged helix-turn-helix transcriptional regulator [Caulobacter sp.]
MQKLADPAVTPPGPQAVADLEASAHAAARLMKLLANEQRLILLCRLAEGECSVGDLADYVGLAQSAASQHLAKLRAEHVVSTRREGQTIFYRLTDPAAIQVIDTLCAIYR